MPRSRLTAAPQIHHCREIDYVVFDIVEPAKRTELLPVPECGPGCDGWIDDDWHDALT
jgi:hypothetical protein